MLVFPDNAGALCPLVVAECHGWGRGVGAQPAATETCPSYTTSGVVLGVFFLETSASSVYIISFGA